MLELAKIATAMIGGCFSDERTSTKTNLLADDQHGRLVNKEPGALCALCRAVSYHTEFVSGAVPLPGAVSRARNFAQPIAVVNAFSCKRIARR